MNSYELQCYREEFELLRKINHPNVVKVYDLKEDKDAVYLIMEYLNGPTLTDYLVQIFDETEGQGFDEEQAAEIFAK
jgi:serine/threonine protein kinase